MFNYLKIQKNKPLSLKTIFILSIIRRAITLHLGAHQLDSPSHYCKGSGLEIVASDCPYPFANFKMDYADFFNEDRSGYLEKNGFIPLMPPKCQLNSVESNKYDFIYASHVLEHSSNPLRSLQDWVRVVRHGGVIYFVLPNKDKTYDRLRNTTPLKFLNEKFEGDDWAVSLDEVVLMVKQTTGLPEYEVRESEFENLCNKITSHPDGTHHYSIFDPRSSLELVELVVSLFDLRLVNFQLIRHEIHIVLSKNFQNEGEARLH